MAKLVEFIGKLGAGVLIIVLWFVFVRIMMASWGLPIWTVGGILTILGAFGLFILVGVITVILVLVIID